MVDSRFRAPGGPGWQETDAVGEPWLLTPEQVAQRLGISRSKVYELLDEDLPSTQIGRCRRIPAQGLREWLRERGC